MAKTKLGVVANDDNGDIDYLKSLLGTYGVVFLINLIYEVVAHGGAASMTGIILCDALLQAMFITLVIYAGNKGIEWKERS